MCSADGNTCTSGALNILAITAAPLKTLKQGMSLQKLITGKGMKKKCCVSVDRIKGTRLSLL